MRIENYLWEWNYTMLNKPLARGIWIWQAVFLCELISQRTRFGKDEFYFTQSEMEKEIWLSESTQLRYAKELQEKWLISFEKKGIPARNWYTINDDEIHGIIMSGTCAVNLTELETSKWSDYSIINNTNNNIINSNPKDVFYTINDEELIKHENEDAKSWSGFLTYSEKDLEKYWKDMLVEFNRYYSETNSKWKQKRQLQKTWSLGWRLATWKKNNEKRYGKKYEPVDYENNLQLFLTRLKTDYEWLKKEVGTDKFFELKQKALEYWAVNKLL